MGRFGPDDFRVRDCRTLFSPLEKTLAALYHEEKTPTKSGLAQCEMHNSIYIAPMTLRPPDEPDAAHAARRARARERSTHPKVASRRDAPRVELVVRLHAEDGKYHGCHQPKWVADAPAGGKGRRALS